MQSGLLNVACIWHRFNTITSGIYYAIVFKQMCINERVLKFWTNNACKALMPCVDDNNSLR